ncbi:hypothetical protein BDY24DRAFT_391058 [Mrakia frigida]|uniref:uncharacterized protein n=1 Tax=Mrakia frigida TaxID=29902 RepID=UPI003FCC2079
MPLVEGEVCLFAELRLRRQGGESVPVKEHHCEVTDIADTWTCTTWIDLAGEETDSIEYDVHWEDRAPVPRGSKGRLVVDGEPVGTRYINPDKEGDYKGIVDYHRMDEMHCARLEFAKIQVTNDVGPSVRQLTPMAGTVKLEIELGWFVPETRSFSGAFKRINSEHPLFDARPVNAQEVEENAIKGLTHTSKFGTIFARPFPASLEPKPKFVVAPPPFRNGFNGGESRRPFAEFFWIVGKPDHLDNAPQNPVNMAMKTDNGQDQFNPYGSDYNHQYPEAQPMFVPPQVDRARSLSQTPFNQTPPPPSSYNYQNGNGRAQSSQPDGGWGGGTPVASGSGGHGQNGGAAWETLKEEPSDVKPAAVNPSIWTNTNLTAIDLTLDEDDDDDDDEVEDVVMTSGVPSRSAGIAAARPPSQTASLPPPSEAGESVRSGQTTGTNGRLYPPQEDWLAPASTTNTSSTVDPDFPALSSNSTSARSSSAQPQAQKKTIPAQYKVPNSPATSKRAQSEAFYAPTSPETSSEIEQTILKRPRVDSEASRTAVSDSGAGVESVFGGGGSSSQWGGAESTAASSQAGDQERPWEFQKSKKQKQPPSNGNGNGNGHAKPTSYASSVASTSNSGKRPLKLPKAPLVAPGHTHPHDLEDGEEEEPAFEFEGGQVVSSTSSTPAPGGVLAQAEAARRNAEEKNRASGRSSATGGGAGGSVGVGGKKVVGAPGWSVVGNAEEVRRKAALEERRRKEAKERDDGGWGI